jgi:hypothetical protein
MNLCNNNENKLEILIKVHKIIFKIFNTFRLQLKKEFCITV